MKLFISLINNLTKENIISKTNILIKSLKTYITNFYKENIQENITKIPVLLFILLIIIWLRTPIKHFYDSLVVEPIFTWLFQFPIEKHTFILFILLLTLSTVYSWIYLCKNSYKLNFYIITFLLFIISTYTWERLNWNYYDHLNLCPEFSILRGFSLLDPIFFSLSIIFILTTKNSIKWSFSENKNSWMSVDTTLGKIDKDDLNRKTEVENLVKLTKELPYNLNFSYVIGISGSWGYGKTEFLQMTKGILNTKKKNVIVEFNPWFSSGTSNLTEDFFITIDNEISKHIQTGNTILKYGKSLSKIDHPANILTNFTELLFSDPPLKDRFNQISSLINKLDKKVYILIDDLDRLNNLEVFEVLRLVRNTANFPNFIFLIAYDRNYLVNALNNMQIFKPDKYLEKIIQFEIILPRISNEVITNILIENINSKIDYIFENKISLKEPFKRQISEIILDMQELIGNAKPKYQLRLTISQILLNMRDVKRFTNSFIFSLKNHSDNIYLPDLFIIELIKFSNSSLFERLYNNDYSIIKQNNDGIWYSELYYERLKNEIILRAPNHIVSEVLNGSPNITIEGELLDYLFEIPQPEDFNSRFSITYIENFNYYFTLFLDPNKVSFKDIDDLINHKDLNTDEIIIDWVSKSIKEGKTDSLFEKLQFDNNIKTKSELSNYLTILITLIEKSNFDIANNILLKKVINKDFSFLQSSNQTTELFSLIYEKASFPYSKISYSIDNLIYIHIDKDPNKSELIKKLPTKDSLVSQNLLFLKKYFREVIKEEWNYEIIIGLYYNCKINIDEKSREIELSEKASVFLKDQLIKDIGLFEFYLRYFLRYSGIRYSIEELNSSEIGPEPFFRQIFGTEERFLKELEKNNTKISQEIQEFFRIKQTNTVVNIDNFKPTMKLHLNLMKEK